MLVEMRPRVFSVVLCFFVSAPALCQGQEIFRRGDANADGKVDLLYGRNRLQDDLSGTPSPDQVMWFGRMSKGSKLGNYSIWASDAGDDGDVFP